MAFSRTSRDVRLNGNHELFALCQRCDQSWRESTIDLNQVLGNIDGHLAPGLDTFSHTSRNFSLNGSILSAELQRCSGQWISTSIDLDTIISNTDGTLTVLDRQTPEDLSDDSWSTTDLSDDTDWITNCTEDLEISGHQSTQDTIAETYRCIENYDQLKITVIQEIDESLQSTRQHTSTALSEVANLRDQLRGLDTRQFEESKEMLSKSFQDSIQRAVAEHERGLEVISTKSQQLAEFQHATVEPLKARLGQMNWLMRDKVQQIETSIAGLQHMINSLEQQRNNLEETLSIRRQQSENARLRSSLFIAISVIAPFMVPCAFEAIADIQFCHDQIEVIANQINEQLDIQRNYELDLLDQRNAIAEVERMLDQSNIICVELVVFGTELRTRHEELSHFKSVTTRQLLNSSAAQWNSIDRFKDSSCPQDAILVLEAVLMGDLADPPGYAIGAWHV